MKKKPKWHKRPYEILLEVSGTLRRSTLKAVNRKKAVARAQVRFREEFGDTLGPAHKIMVVTDPYNEVVYDKSFKCSDGTNRLLPKDVALRVVNQSNGELELETDKHKGCSLRRVKRKLQGSSTVLEKNTGIHRSPRGYLFYRETVKPFRVKKGKVVQKKKVKDHRLKASDLTEALKEIRSLKRVETKPITTSPSKTTKGFVLTPAAARLLEKANQSKRAKNSAESDPLSSSIRHFLGISRHEAIQKLKALQSKDKKTTPRLQDED